MNGVSPHAGKDQKYIACFFGFVKKAVSDVSSRWFDS